MRSIADGTVSNPSTIDDETIIDEIKTVLIKYEIGTFNKNNTK
jgi:propionyl-CoA synthetase